MVPVVTGILILVAVALIATSGLPNTLKPEPIRQLTVENFATKKAVVGGSSTPTPSATQKKAVLGTAPAPKPIAPVKIASPLPKVAVPPPKAITPPKASVAPLVKASDKPKIVPPSQPAKANISTINVTPEAKSRVNDIVNIIDMALFAKLEEKLKSQPKGYGAQDFINEAWEKVFLKAQNKYNAKYPKTTTTLLQVYAAVIQEIALHMQNNKSFKNGPIMSKALINSLKVWKPATPPAPPLAKAAPKANLASKPAPAPKPAAKPAPAPKPATAAANVGANNIQGNQFSLATITLPVNTSINGNTISLTAAGAPKAMQPVPANMVQAGAAPAISGSEMDKIINGLVKESLRTELENIGRADKVAMTRKGTPGLSQGKEFNNKMPPDYKGAVLNPNAASADGGYNHLGPLSDYQDSYHPPLMPDGGYYDPRIYVRKDSVPCYGCSLDY